jgi:hypothetical protein
MTENETSFPKQESEMARKKEQPKPLFTLKHDFYASLDEVAQRAIVLIQAIESALDLGQIGDAAKPIVREHLDAFRKSLLSDG